MSGSRTILRDRLARLGLAGQAAAVIAVLAIAWLVSAPIAYEMSGPAGPLAAGAAAAVCLLGAQLAVVIMSLLRGPASAVYALGLAMLARTMVPLVLGVVLHRQVPALQQAGMIYYLLVYYMLALATETALAVAHVPSGSDSHPTAH